MKMRCVVLGHGCHDPYPGHILYREPDGLCIDAKTQRMEQRVALF
ncbi:hypothetical protein AF72_08650 [Xylella taiwanensis]|uniref:Uncharacterized protein n=1 Tax=Xylella taiwanensis TaxID=1444770 RepID=Z9JJ94_9GAMM|nr:hypothetical protein AF72_08650 [Xylella taiwanensis]